MTVCYMNTLPNVIGQKPSAISGKSCLDLSNRSIGTTINCTSWGIRNSSLIYYGVLIRSLTKKIIARLGFHSRMFQEKNAMYEMSVLQMLNYS